jgi:hypothetical protein
MATPAPPAQDAMLLQSLLQQLQSKAFPTRKKAAEQLNRLSFEPRQYPQVDPAKLSSFEQALRTAAAEAVDPAIFKRAFTVGALFPGFIPLLLCIVGSLVIKLGAIFWGVATLWLLFWYFRTLARGLKAQTESARSASALAKELGLVG